ncbi:efflux RND transporter periplasmic adaptor subunit [Acuticoccus sp.]|uniref:efflux RND transporter periplasmic adaptor subunit n=1 Tax=Acuticoccus sp. TaxID=1904378 RepID=UPI003B5192C9
MRGKLLLAALMTGGIVAWMATGELVVSGSAEVAEVRPPAERSGGEGAPFRVRTRTIEAAQRERTLTMRGRTRADALVNVAAETAGQVEERPVGRGDRATAGDVLCRLDQGVRAAELAQAEAEAAKAQLDYDAATKLQGRGFESQTRVAATRAALDAAQALVAAAQQEVERTVVRAPISGTVQEPIAEVGASLAVGDVCATIVDADPIVVTGQVSERNIRDVLIGVEARVELVTGGAVDGTVSYVSRTADPDTRTFKVEITVPNPDEALRDGVTAEAHIPLSPVKAHRLSPGVLTLSDAGEVGVRTVKEDGTVAFRPVTIAVQDTDGFWVTGLPDTVTVITVGQDYVVDGQAVEPVDEDARA